MRLPPLLALTALVAAVPARAQYAPVVHADSGRVVCAARPLLLHNAMAFVEADTRLLSIDPEPGDKVLVEVQGGDRSGTRDLVWADGLVSCTPGPGLPSRTRRAPSARPRSAAPAAQPQRPASRTYVRGPRGGCYYVTTSGNREYVDRSFCN